MKIVLTAVEASAVFMFLVFAATAITATPNIGNISGCVLCAALFAACIKHRELITFISGLWNSKWRWTVILFTVLIVLCICAAAVISAFMIKHMEIPAPRNTPVIVLGCQVRKNGPSPMLADRTDTAYEYLCENPEAVCIASGGKGDDEPCSEASVIKERLVEKGIDENRIIIEDQSVSTYTNMKNSLEMIDRLGLPHEAVIVTSEFHQFRSHIIAGRAGIKCYARSSHTQAAFLPTYWLREFFGVVYTLIFKR
ncbi:MAG: YdcF family protein [Oscillospiraceae bacterium]|nr:YdcF family protein [Oscillospiraceae bacterium]